MHIPFISIPSILCFNYYIDSLWFHLHLFILYTIRKDKNRTNTFYQIVNISIITHYTDAVKETKTRTGTVVSYATGRGKDKRRADLIGSKLFNTRRELRATEYSHVSLANFHRYCLLSFIPLPEAFKPEVAEEVEQEKKNNFIRLILNSTLIPYLHAPTFYLYTFGYIREKESRLKFTSFAVQCTNSLF